MRFIFVFLGTTTLLLFLYKREWLLDKKKGLLLFVWNCILFLSSFILSYYEIGDAKFYVALKMSLLTQLMFLIMAFIFKKVFGRAPQDTFWGSDPSLMADSAFNFTFWVLAVVIPAGLVFTGLI
jgi:hypothetical protein